MICPECKGAGCVHCDWTGVVDDSCEWDAPDPTGGDVTREQ